MSENALDMIGYKVHTVTSVHRGPAMTIGHTKRGTVSLVRSDCDSLRTLMEYVRAMSRSYGYEAQECQFGQGSTRWTWERWSPEGVHISDMIIASLIG